MFIVMGFDSSTYRDGSRCQCPSIFCDPKVKEKRRSFYFTAVKTKLLSEPSVEEAMKLHSKDGKYPFNVRLLVFSMNLFIM